MDVFNVKKTANVSIEVANKRYWTFLQFRQMQIFSLFVQRSAKFIPKHVRPDYKVNL